VGPTIAFVIVAIGTAYLFYLDRDKLAGNSKALWLPVIWLWIIGSRPVSAWLYIWFGIGGTLNQGLDAQLDGSPIDSFVFTGLLVAGVAVLLRRKRLTALLLKSSAPLLLYLFYCLVSCSWSPFPDVAFKRWIKNVADLAMVLVVVTDPKPIVALRRIFSRVGLILFPASLLLVRFTTLGYAYDPGGAPLFTGVTTNKNSLGLITFVISLGAVWSCLDLLRADRSRKRSRQVLARVTLVAFGVAVLQEARSATSIACFIVGSALILITNISFFRRRPQRIHALVLTTMLLGVIALLFGGEATVAGALGRDPKLSDRTTIWEAVIPVCPNPVVGAGFESFWNGYGKYVTGNLSIYERGLNSAHNGYIEVWLNLGWVGVGLIAMLLISGYRRAYAAFRHNAGVGSLMLAYVATDTLYGITEASFRIMTPTLIFLFLVIAGGRRIASTASGGMGQGVGFPEEKSTAHGWIYGQVELQAPLT
jgi:exopolysaccharide production protein ExoQ